MFFFSIFLYYWGFMALHNSRQLVCLFLKQISIQSRFLLMQAKYEYSYQK